MTGTEEFLRSGLLDEPAVLLCGAAIMVFLIGMPPFALVLRMKRIHRNLLHEERMQALERIANSHDADVIQPFLAELQQDGQSTGYGRIWIAFAMGCLVPVSAFAAVSLQDTTHEGVQIASWIAAIIVSVACIVCATVLAAISPRRTNRQSKGKTPGVSSVI